MPGKSLRARGRSSSMKGTMMKTEKGTRRNRSDTVRTSCLQPIREGSCQSYLGLRIWIRIRNFFGSWIRICNRIRIIFRSWIRIRNRIRIIFGSWIRIRTRICITLGRWIRISTRIRIVFGSWIRIRTRIRIIFGSRIRIRTRIRIIFGSWIRIRVRVKSCIGSRFSEAQNRAVEGSKKPETYTSQEKVTDGLPNHTYMHTPSGLAIKNSAFRHQCLIKGGKAASLCHTFPYSGSATIKIRG
jgi:hypothetical protein